MGIERKEGLGIKDWKDNHPHRITCSPFGLRGAFLLGNTVQIKVDSQLTEHTLVKGKEIDKRASQCQFYIEISKETFEEIVKQIRQKEGKLVPVVSLEEFKKVKEERDGFLKVLRMDNKRGLKLEKDRHTSKVKLIDKAIELGLVEKEMYQGTEMLVGTLKGNTNEMVDTEWGELQDWVNRQRVINLKLGKDLLSKAMKKAKGEK